MSRGWILRLIGGAATTLVAALALVVGSAVLAGRGIATLGAAAIALTAFSTTLALLPAYAPRPRRALDRLKAAAIGATLAMGVLGFAGYLGVGFVPDPVLLAVTGGALTLVVPVLASRLRRLARPERILLAGDDAGKLGDVVHALDSTPMGHLSPPRLSLATASPDSLDVGRLRTDGGIRSPDEDAAESRSDEEDPASGDDAARAAPGDEAAGSVSEDDESSSVTGDDAAGSVSGNGSNDSTPEREAAGAAADLKARATGATDAPAERSTTARPSSGAAGPSTERLSGLARLPHVLVARDVDEVILGYSVSDRQEFFGALRVCRELGVDAKVHESHEAATLVDGDADADGPILDVAVEPLPLHSRLAKRAFDVCFATVGLVALAPLIALIAVAIKLDSPGPVLYGQRRTARLGSTFTLPKFRSMVDDAEDGTGPTLSDEDAGDVDPRVTSVGRVLRASHFDEIPQLVSVLRGDMSVVGPRPERPELESEFTADGLEWERRWFVKPGLTGLAQINDVTGFEPEEKLTYDLEYAERQSLLLDLRVVLVQIAIALSDALDLLRGRES